MDLAFVAQLFVSGIVLGSSYALAAISFGIIFSTTRIFHLAHSMSYTLAAYAGVVAVTSFGLPLWAAFPFAILTAVVVGVGIEALVYRPLRRNGAVSLPFFLSALGLQVAGSNLIGIVFGRANQPMRGFPNQTISFGTVTITTLEITSVVIAWVCVAALLIFLRKTQYGHAITATRTNPTMARAVGISVDNVYLVVFAIGSLMIGVAAFLLTAGNVANPTVGLQPILIAFIAVFLGGIESVSGAALGGLLLGLATTMSGLFLTANFAPVIVFGLLFILLVVRPQGLLGKAQV